MPTAATTERVHVLPDATCPECRAQRKLCGKVWWCERCLVESPVPVDVNRSPEPVAMPGPTVDYEIVPSVIQRPSYCARCSSDRVWRWMQFVCPGCGSTPEGGQIENPRAPTAHATPPPPLLPFEVLHCTGEDCRLARRDLRFGKLVCPVCGDAVPHPDGGDEASLLRPEPAAVPVPKAIKASPAAAPPGAPPLSRPVGRRSR